MTSQHHGYLCATVTKAATGERKILARWKHNLLCNAGRDAFHNLCYINVSAGSVAYNFIAVTEATITPAAGDTTLSAEITTNGLGRAASSPIAAHTNGTNTSTMEKTYTASGAFTDVKASATFNASSGGTMAHIANFTTGSGTLATNDTLKVTWTLQLG